MDALSEALRAVRLVGAIFVDARLSAPWCLATPSASAAVPYLEPHAERVVIFHWIVHGACFAEYGLAPACPLEAGDVVLFPGGDPHRLASRPGLPPADLKFEDLLQCRPQPLRIGGGGDETVVVCGYLACSARVAGLLLAGLPLMLRVNIRDRAAGPWLEASLRYALEEARLHRPGGAGLLSKLAELLFIQVLRLAVETEGVCRTGWLAAAGDRVVAAALHAMHSEPARGWTLDALARVACTSRSVLAERFQQLVGRSPIQYLAQWRMLLAADLLRGSVAPLVDIAKEVGYLDDSAFSRAFRREFGSPPAAWRRKRRAERLQV